MEKLELTRKYGIADVAMMRPLVRLPSAFCGLMLLALSINVAVAETRVALVVGNSAYKNSSLALNNPKNDAQDVGATLRGLGFEVIVAVDATKRDLDLAMTQFARAATNADAALFFYAGHAIQYQGRNYLLPVDAELEDEVSLRYQTVSLDDVRAAVERASGVKIVILDACRNNPIVDSLKRRMMGMNRGLDLTRGLARIDKAEGSIVAYATAADEVASDGPGRNSPFSAALIKRLQEPGLEIAKMFRRIAADVVETTYGRQRPEIYVSLIDEYYINQKDRLVWDQIKDKNDPKAFRDFVANYPSSPRVSDAQYRLDMLERLARERQAEKEKAEQDAIKARLAEAEGIEREAAQRRQAEEAAKQQAAKEAVRQEAAQQQAAKQQAAKEAVRQEAAQQQAAKQQAAKEAVRQEAAQQQAAKQQAAKEAVRQEAARQQAAKEAARQEAAKQEEAARQEAARHMAAKEAARQEAAKQDEAARQEAARQQAAKSEVVKQEFAKPEAARIAMLERDKAEREKVDAVQRLHDEEQRKATTGEREKQARLTTGPAQEPAAQPKTAPEMSQEQTCKRDEERLARLRAEPVADEIARFERELGCAKLRPQIARLRESVNIVEAHAETAVPPPAAHAPFATPEPAPAPPPVVQPEPVHQQATPSQPKAAPESSPEPDCKRDEERLARLRANPVANEIARFEHELSCAKLRPQLVRLRESIATSEPRPDNGAAPQATESRANPELSRSVTPAASSPSSQEICKHDEEVLARLRANPAPDEIARFERELGCPRLRPQVVRLRESINAN